MWYRVLFSSFWGLFIIVLMALNHHLTLVAIVLNQKPIRKFKSKIYIIYITPNAIFDSKNLITSSVKVSCFIASHWTRGYHVKITVCFVESRLPMFSSASLQETLAVSAPKNKLSPSVTVNISVKYCQSI